MPEDNKGGEFYKNFSTRTANALKGAGLGKSDLQKMSDEEVLELKGIGKKGLEEIKSKVKSKKSKVKSGKKEKKEEKEEILRQAQDDKAGGKSVPTLSKKKKKGEPKNMEELLASSGYEIRIPKRGETVEGLVTTKKNKMVLIDIGAKTEGIVADKEYEKAKDFIENLLVGQSVDVYVLNEETDSGQILLSLQEAMKAKLWKMLKDYEENEKAIQVQGVETNKGGMIARWKGLRGFVPTSQFGSKWAGDLEQLVSKEFDVKLIEVDEEKNRLIFSEKHVSEAKAIERKEKALDKIEMGDVYEGVVTGVMSFGAFVGVEVPVGKKKKEKVGKVEGLVHISEISWEKVDDVKNYVKVGEKVKVKVLGVEEGTGKLNLSIKQLKNDPWDTVEKKYAEGKKIKGTVSRIAPFGVFVNFEPGVDGLIHVSKLPADENMKKGDEVEVFVENLDVKNRRMSLTMYLTEVPVGYK